MTNVIVPPIRSRKKKTNKKTYVYHKCSFGKFNGEELSMRSSDRRAVALWRQEKLKDLQELGDLAAELSSEVKLDAILASRILPPEVSLQEAAKCYLENHPYKLAQNQITVGAAADQYVRARDEDFRNGLIREETLLEIEKRIGRFGFDFRNTDLCDCQSRDIERKINKEWSLKPRTANQYFTVLNTFFNWCVKQGWLPDNPVAGIQRHRVKAAKGTARFLSPLEADKLMRAAYDKEPELVPYIAIGMYAGLRPEETKRLRWEDVKLTDENTSFIRVEQDVSKTGQARIVSVPTILFHILADYSRKGERYIFHSRKRLAKVRDLSGVPWANSILRHTFATYHLAMFQDSGNTAHEMGHRDASMLYRHYAGLATKEQAREFWGLGE